MNHKIKIGSLIPTIVILIQIIVNLSFEIAASLSYALVFDLFSKLVLLEEAVVITLSCKLDFYFSLEFFMFLHVFSKQFVINEAEFFIFVKYGNFKHFLYLHVASAFDFKVVFVEAHVVAQWIGLVIGTQG